MTATRKGTMKQTIKELAALIGKQGEYNVSQDMWIYVTIEDVRISYGEVRVQIAPVKGRGTTWVPASNVKAVA